MTEDEIRDLTPYGGPPEVTFCGSQYAIRGDGFAALLRYARASATELGKEEENGARRLAAVYQLLEDCVTDFPDFAAAALRGKAGTDEIMAVVQRLTEYYCARGHWPAMRLIGFIAGDFGALDGMCLHKTGRGLAGLSAREACNLALAICLDGRSEEDRDIFLEDLEYEGNPEAEALAMVRQMQADRARAAEAARDG